MARSAVVRMMGIVACLWIMACSRPPVGPTTPTPLPVPIAPAHCYGRPLWTGPFFRTSIQYGVFTSPGNIEVLADGVSASARLQPGPVVATAGDPLAVGVESYRTVPDQDLLAIMVSIGGNGQPDRPLLERARRYARARGTPLLIYFDSAATPPPSVLALLEPNDWYGLMGYPRSATESVEETIARLRLRLQALGGTRVAFIRTLYTQGGRLSLTQVEALQVPYTNLIREFSNVVADLWFSWARPSGALEYPSLQEVAQQLSQAGAC